MSGFEDGREFGRRVSAVRGWMRMQRPDFAEFMDVSESTIWRWEEGDIGKKRANPEARRAFARMMVEKTECPPDLFGLNEPESDARWQQVEDSLNFLLDALRRLMIQALEGDELDEFQQWWTSDPRSGGLDL